MRMINNSELKNTARMLRKRMTKQERRIWYDFLRKHPLHFYRQRVIGPYIADFYCARAGLVIELDGSQHYSERGLLRDKIRTEYMETLGLTVLRIQNAEIDTNFEGICLYIDRTVKSLIAVNAFAEEE